MNENDAAPPIEKNDEGTTDPQALWSTEPPPQDLEQPASISESADVDTLLKARATAGTAIDASLGEVVAERYLLLQELGRGGMGRVYIAEHLGLGKPVAFKVMHERLAQTEEYLRRFKREARAAATIEHPNVVRILDYGEHQGAPYLAMELVQGPSLDEWLRAQPELPTISQVVAIVTQVFDALSALHDAGVVHRDLKPANIVLANLAQGSPLVKLLDFGLAQFEDPTERGASITHADVVAGSPEYMSPEQTRSLRVSPSADLYAVGCILTELLQRRPPFIGDTAMDVFSQHLFAPPPPLDRPEGAEPVPPLLEQLRLNLLAKHQSRRPIDARDANVNLSASVDPNALAFLLSRRGSVPPGTRDARVPEWNAAKTQSSVPLAPTEAVRVGILVLEIRAGGCDTSCRTGLRASGFDVEVVDSPADGTQLLQRLLTLSTSTLVLDAGTQTELGLKLVRSLREASGPRAVVCAANVGADQLNRWIEAGAADVVPHPVAPDRLARSLRRLG